MKMTIKVTTIAIKFEDHWTVDTYARNNAKNDKNFVSDFMNEYAGNGIIEMNILETEELYFEIDRWDFLDSIWNALDKKYPNLNRTILNY